MIKKIIACSDIHIPSYHGISDLKTILTTFIEECKNIVSKYNKDEVRIVIAGDIYHNKLNISNESQIAIYWFLSNLGQICKTIVIAGNHDMLIDNSDRIDSLTPVFEMGKLDNVLYLDKSLGYKSGCFVDDNIIWCLYSSFDGFIIPDIEAEKIKYKSDNQTYVGLIHADVNGAVTATNRITENGLEPAIFDKCDFVIAGHIHKKQEINKNGVKIVYCSSINQKDFGETVTEHGFVLWDVPTKTYEYQEINASDYGYYKFEINSLDDINLDKEKLLNYK